MRIAPSRATLLISIDLPAPPQHGQRTDSELHKAAGPLHRLLVEQQLSATWGLCSLQGTTLIEKLRCSSLRAPQEIALLGRPAWTAARRNEFARHLQRHAEQAHRADLELTTLLVHGAALPEHGDLLVEHGFCAVRAARPVARHRGWLATLGAQLRQLAGRPRDGQQPHAPRWGLLRTDAQSWLPGHSVGRLKRQIEHAMGEAAVVHVAIDAVPWSAEAPGLQRRFAKLLAWVARQRDAGNLEIGTVRQTATRLLFPQRPAPAQSILRRRAA